jgi:hypothetical protein
MYLVHDIKTTKPSILFSPIFSQQKEKKNFSLVQTREKACFKPIKSLFYFSIAQAEKNSWKNLGRQDWWFGGLMSRTRYIHNALEYKPQIVD